MNKLSQASSCSCYSWYLYRFGYYLRFYSLSIFLFAALYHIQFNTIRCSFLKKKNFNFSSKFHKWKRRSKSILNQLESFRERFAVDCVIFIEGDKLRFIYSLSPSLPLDISFLLRSYVYVFLHPQARHDDILHIWLPFSLFFFAPASDT